MKVGDLVKFAGYLRDVSPKGSIPKIGMITALCGKAGYPRVEVLWPSGDLKKMRAELFEVAINESL
jgi:hypothetical protein